ncbi:MAG: HEPN domain-containing protein [Gammaproteobacteria bacterium]|nr:HEPN domain-containing protein [Gammaproteobacteria bacterium]
MRPPEWHMERAYRRLAAARSLARDGFVEDAFSRLYYAAMEAAHTALTSLNIDPPKKHSALRGAFRNHVIVPGRIPKTIGITLDHMESVRLGADYRGLEPAAPDFERAKENVEALVEAVRDEFLGEFSPAPLGSDE